MLALQKSLTEKKELFSGTGRSSKKALSTNCLKCTLPKGINFDTPVCTPSSYRVFSMSVHRKDDIQKVYTESGRLEKFWPFKLHIIIIFVKNSKTHKWLDI